MKIFRFSSKSVVGFFLHIFFVSVNAQNRCVSRFWDNRFRFRTVLSFLVTNAMKGCNLSNKLGLMEEGEDSHLWSREKRQYLESMYVTTIQTFYVSDIQDHLTLVLKSDFSSNLFVYFQKNYRRCYQIRHKSGDIYHKTFYKKKVRINSHWRSPPNNLMKLDCQ